MNPLLYAKVIVGLALGAALSFGGYHVADLKGKAALASLQHAWDQDKAAIQKVTDDAIAKATQERDTALQANEAISNDYQAKLSTANSDAAQFAQRLRNAENIIAANRGALPKANDNASPATTGAARGSDQLGQLVALVTGLRTECKANSDQLDALSAEMRPQL